MVNEHSYTRWLHLSQLHRAKFCQDRRIIMTAEFRGRVTPGVLIRIVYLHHKSKHSRYSIRLGVFCAQIKWCRYRVTFAVEWNSFLYDVKRVNNEQKRISLMIQKMIACVCDVDRFSVKEEFKYTNCLVLFLFLFGYYCNNTIAGR